MGWFPPTLPVRPVFPALTRHVDRKLPACEPVVGEPDHFLRRPPVDADDGFNDRRADALRSDVGHREDRHFPRFPDFLEDSEVVGVVVIGEVEDAPALEVLKNPLHRSSSELKRNSFSNFSNILPQTPLLQLFKLR